MMPYQIHGLGRTGIYLFQTWKVPFSKRSISTALVLAKNSENSGKDILYRTGVNFDTLGTWKHKLDLPLHVEHSLKKGTLIPRIELNHVGMATMKGRRTENEDRILMRKINNNLLLFGLFDGHGGAMAADFVGTYIQDAIVFWMRQGVSLMEDLLQKVFIEINNLMARHVYYYGPCKLRNSGTTATVALLRNSVDLVVGHVGDSRAVLCRSGHPHSLTSDDCPGVVAEQDRIRDRGGVVSSNSLGVPVVNGRLGMTRSLGDAELKAYGVVAHPHIEYAQIRHGRDAFLAMVTDGVTFVMSNQEVVELISSCHTPKEAAKMVADQALQFGSEDNSSVIVIPFGSWGKYAKSGKPNRYSFGRNMLGTRFFG